MRLRSLACSVSLAWVISVAAPALATAQTTAQSREARTLFEQGRALSTQEHWVDALDAFQRSRALVDRATTVFNIAAVLVRLGRSHDALAALDELAGMLEAPRDHALAEQAAALRAEAEASLRHVVLQVAPEAARVEVDGRVLEGSGPERSATLDPGEHTVVVTLDGYSEARFTLGTGDDAREVALSPLDGSLVVTSTVEAAAIAIDGTARGVGHVEASVAPGGHVVALDAEGYLAFERRVEVGPGERVSVDAALEPVPRGEELVESPLFWGLTGGGAAVVAAVIIGVAFATAGTEAAYGGSSGVIVATLGGP